MNQKSERAATVAIIGGGIVGLATAWKLHQQQPKARISVLEKENQLASHQSGHNSGVLHSGVYYKPGSLKAKLSIQGREEMVQFCQQHDIKHEVCGKVIVAVEEQQLLRLEELDKRAAANGVCTKRIGPEELREREPHVAGISALHVPDAGITDYQKVCEKLGELLTQSGNKVGTGTMVTDIEERNDVVRVATSTGDLEADFVVTCGGLQSDRLARYTDPALGTRILPFRGEYFDLVPEKRHLVKSLIYPVPDPHFPFLGVHLTRMIDGSIHAGPNAVPALAREGYSWRKTNLKDLAEIVTNPGWWKLAKNYWRTGMGEFYRSCSKSAFLAAVQQLVPEIQLNDLRPSPAGVRAQAVSRSGVLLDDFVWLETNRVLNVINAPSPAATASFAIGQQIVERLSSHLK